MGAAEASGCTAGVCFEGLLLEFTSKAERGVICSNLVLCFIVIFPFIRVSVENLFGMSDTVLRTSSGVTVGHGVDK
jgi:hypothetical protein